ncbi:alpha-1,6-mannosyl-glycoprotein 4-beta-N-acetylglucosaminyltransferase-like isoform X2 [Canis lupus baileyi]|uniref:MGAT4 family, member F n=1 Tax=Canis lupus familiaris TaxID=9615 RepID=A0A8P0NCD1_CANLF|eukprot:XP_005622264.2 alpha-1,3-mannosyl-glycoprotein 4-beta-N-acetylglucosaminyltransferase C-like [Canis lupus familiaris]
MRGRPWGCVIAAVPLVVLSFLLQENEEEHLTENPSLEEKKKMLWRLNQEQLGSESRDHLAAFKDMREAAPVLQQATYRLLAGSPPQGRRLLVAGIASEWGPRGTYLLDTLRSLFQASSEAELDNVLVLVHLSGGDPAWLGQTTANISGLFGRHIEAGRLLVIGGGLGGAPGPGHPGSPSRGSACGARWAGHRASYALLMNFAHNLSEYFLVMGDRVRCSPEFISSVSRVLWAWRALPWAVLEFSGLRLSGKVVHAGDLGRLASLLLFPADLPIPSLLSEFRLLLAQDAPIRFNPAVFHGSGRGSAAGDPCAPPGEEEEEEEEASGEPDNPAATVLSDMMAAGSAPPQVAYVLNKECYSVLSPVRGNYLAVAWDRPQRVARVAVLTGSEPHGLHLLHQGRVELGLGPWVAGHCGRHSLLGPLVAGRLDQAVFSEARLSCLRLLVLMPQEPWLLVRQIRVWTRPEEADTEPAASGEDAGPAPTRSAARQ